MFGDLELTRGVVIAAIGFANFLLLLFLLAVCWEVALICSVVGLATWLLARRDLRRIREGESPSAERGLILAGYVCGVTSTCLAVIAPLVVFTVALPHYAIWVWLGLIPLMFGGVLVALAVLLWKALQEKCPKCGVANRFGVAGRETIGRKKCFGLVTRRSNSIGLGVLSSGDRTSTLGTSGLTSWEERVPVIRTTYRLHWKCDHCGEKWTTREVEEAEDFDRP